MGVNFLLVRWEPDLFFELGGFGSLKDLGGDASDHVLSNAIIHVEEYHYKFVQ